MNTYEEKRLTTDLSVLREVAKEYPERLLRMLSCSWRRDWRKLAIVPQNNKTIAYEKFLANKR